MQPFNWTLTWDVFKYDYVSTNDMYGENWTLTWDVFKLIIDKSHIKPKFQLNINMRCI